MKSAIVTGGSGFIGVHLVERLLAFGIDVTALCRAGSNSVARLPAAVNSVASFAELPTADVFYHLAYDGASGAARNDALRQNKNVEFTLQAVCAAKRLCCKKFVGLGTVYEKTQTSVTERANIQGSDFYVLTKSQCHRMSDKLAFQLNLPYIWATICHPIGKYNKPEQMLAGVIAIILNGEKADFGFGLTLYDIVAALDVANGLYLLGEHNVAGREYYIGTETIQPLRKYVEETASILGRPDAINFGAFPDDGLRLKAEWMDITPLSAETGYTQQTSFAKSVKLVYDWLKGEQNAR
jgi:nucleoside-diphosphate-sugar epimerase